MLEHYVKTNQPEEPMLLSGDVCQWIKMSPETFRKMLSRGAGPPGYRIGNQWRFRRADVERWLAERSRPGAAK